MKFVLFLDELFFPVLDELYGMFQLSLVMDHNRRDNMGLFFTQTGIKEALWGEGFCIKTSTVSSNDIFFQ